MLAKILKKIIMITNKKKISDLYSSHRHQQRCQKLDRVQKNVKFNTSVGLLAVALDDRIHKGEIESRPLQLKLIHTNQIKSKERAK